MSYQPQKDRYEHMKYERCGNSGILLSSISLGLWQNFGGINTYENSRSMVRKAFDLGITHFDLANNYGPPPGSAEETFGKILADDLKPWRDELIISTKAGYDMWAGPYGSYGSRKHILSSLDQSLLRMKLDYVDIFYHHRPDPKTPIEESMDALSQIVHQGKALYVGISNYRPEEAAKALSILKANKTPCLIHQARYSMLDRWVEDGLLDLLESEQVGCIAFSPLAKGMLTNRYLDGIPSDSRAGGPSVFLRPEDLTEEVLAKIKKLNRLAENRGQTLAQMALAWVFHEPRITSVLIGASKVSQIEDCVKALDNVSFTDEEQNLIESILTR
jgi:L-glyceraldehyde 3-phosphate reductase